MLNRLAVVSFGLWLLSGCSEHSSSDDDWTTDVGPAPATGSLVLHLPFSGNANDASSYNNHAEVKGAVLAADRKKRFNRAYEFDGTDDTISVPNDPSLELDSAVTVGAWILPVAVREQDILGKGGSSSASYYVGLQEEEGARIVFSLSIDGTTESVERTGYVPGDWFSVVGTYDGTTMMLYVNGILEQQKAVSGSLDGNASPLVIGTKFEGRIDEVRVYTIALDQEAIQKYYLE